MEYVPLSGSVVASTKTPEVPKVVAGTSVAPPGDVIDTRPTQQLGPTFRLTRRPAVPLKSRRASCPGTEVVTITRTPSATIVSTTSEGTSSSVSVSPPVFAPTGSTTTVYVPVTGSVLPSRKPPFVPTFVEAIVVPSGRRRETVVPLRIDPIVTSVIRSETSWPAVPAKATRAFCPGVPTVTRSGAPVTIVSVTSGGTS